jgi:predicted extracellular nuclease
MYMRRLILRLPLAAALALSLSTPGCREDDTKTDSGVQKDRGPGSGENPPGGDVTIYDINTLKVADQAAVVLRDVVIGAVDGYGQYTGDVYVQESKGGPNAGLKLYQPQRVDGGEVRDLKPGDHVKVEGKVKHFTPSTPFNDSKHPSKKFIVELDKGCSITRLAGGTPPAPVELTIAKATEDPDAPTYEHMVVSVKNVGVSKPLETKYNEYEVGGALSVDDELFPTSSPKIGDCQSLTGILIYFYNYKILPREQADVGAGSGCPAVKRVAIKDIQDTTSADHPAADSTVTTTGVISAVDSTLSLETKPRYIGYWIQEEGAGAPWSGIYVYYYWDASTAQKPALGDIVEVTAKYLEYKSGADTVSELSSPVWTVKGKSTNPPQVATLPAADIATGGSKAEQYEGVLVKVENVEVESITQTTGTPPRKIGIKLKGSGLIVENELFDFMTPEPTLGTKYASIAGVLHFSFDNFKILPRSAADMVK